MAWGHGQNNTGMTNLRGRPTSARTFRSFLPIVVIAIIAAGVGGFAGGLIAAMSCDWNVKEAGCIESTAYGTVIGESVLMSVAVQAVIWPHRNLALVLLTPLTVGAIAVVGLLAPVGGE